MARPSSRLDPGSVVLVTGANGYIASTVVDILLKQGFNVRGTVRSFKPWLQKMFDEKYGYGRFETVVLPDLRLQEDLEVVLEGAQGLIHVASALSCGTDAEEAIDETRAHTLAALQAAANVPTIRSFVLTSSMSATYSPDPDKNGIIVTEDSWNEKAVSASRSTETSIDDLPSKVYAASKTEGERALWNFVRDHKPHFAVNTILPAATFGTILCPEIGGSTMGVVRQLISGDAQAFDVMPGQWFVDVTDCGRLHVAALLDKSIEQQRIFATAEPFTWTDIVAILCKIRPQIEGIPDPPSNEGRDLSQIEARYKAEHILRSYWGLRGWTTLEESIIAGINDLLSGDRIQ